MLELRLVDPDVPVVINTSPDIPHDPMSTMFMLVKVSTELNRHLVEYLEHGDLDDLRRSSNCMLILQSMQANMHLPQLVAAGMRGVHPISDEERKSVLLAFEPGNA